MVPLAKKRSLKRSNGPKNQVREMVHNIDSEIN